MPQDKPYAGTKIATPQKILSFAIDHYVQTSVDTLYTPWSGLSLSTLSVKIQGLQGPLAQPRSHEFANSSSSDTGLWQEAAHLTLESLQVVPELCLQRSRDIHMILGSIPTTGC